jgi:hypothetical protein
VVAQSVGIVRLRTQAMEFSFLVTILKTLYAIYIVDYKMFLVLPGKFSDLDIFS